MTKVLGKSDLLSGSLLRRELVQLPSMGASIWMREMQATHVIEFRNFIEQFKADGVKDTTFEQDIEIMALVVSFSACDENGNLLFASPEEAKGLTINGTNLLMDLGNKALELSRVGVSKQGMTSTEVTDSLPNAQAPSLSANSPANSTRHRRKS